jgi:hypothetical protein
MLAVDVQIWSLYLSLAAMAGHKTVDSSLPVLPWRQLAMAPRSQKSHRQTRQPAPF